MTPEQVTLEGIIWSEGVMVPILDGDGTWTVLGYDATSYYDSATDVRRAAAQMEAEEVPPGEVEAYRMLADLMDEIVGGDQPPGEG